MSRDPRDQAYTKELYTLLENDPLGAVDLLGLLRVVLFDDDFTTEAVAQFSYWAQNYTDEGRMMVRVESAAAFQTAIGLMNTVATLFNEEVTVWILMFHGGPQFITLGSGIALEFLSANGQTVTPLGYPALPISRLGDVPLCGSAVIQLNTCRGGMPLAGGLMNVGQAFNARYGVGTIAFPYWIKYASEDSWVVIPTTGSVALFPRLQAVIYPRTKEPCRNICPSSGPPR